MGILRNRLAATKTISRLAHAERTWSRAAPARPTLHLPMSTDLPCTRRQVRRPRALRAPYLQGAWALWPLCLQGAWALRALYLQGAWALWALCLQGPRALRALC
jgi:hypothetical protein